MADEEEVGLSSDQFNCPICLCDVPIKDVFCLRQCGCLFCQTCLSELVQLHIKEQAIQRLKCPSLHINDFPIQRDEIKKLANREDFLTYTRLKHDHVIMKDPSCIFCPQPNCGAVCHSKRFGPRPTRCCTCSFKFCRLCLNAWPGHNHLCPEDLGLPLTPQTVAPISQGESPSSVTDAEAEPTMTNSMSVKPSGEKEKFEVKRCPKCGVPIEKTAGCRQMYCATCGHSFCWFCLADLDHEVYMLHVLRGKCTTNVANVSSFRRCVDCLTRTSAVCGLGIWCLLCAPITIICSPCIALCIPGALNQVYQLQEDEPAVPTNLPVTAAADEEDTDSEMDPET